MYDKLKESNSDFKPFCEVTRTLLEPLVTFQMSVSCYNGCLMFQQHQMIRTKPQTWKKDELHSFYISLN